MAIKEEQELPSPVAETEAAVAPLLVDRVNRVRASAGLAPLSLEVKQSAENARLNGLSARLELVRG